VEIVLVNASVYGLPTSRRAGAIVYDGPTDLDLWRPPGPDRDLLHVYGESLVNSLDRERKELPGRTLTIGQALRVHAGKLHCDYMIWVASRPPHGDEEPAPAPSVSSLEVVAQNALELANKHHTTRVAFGVLGAGPGAGEPGDRLAALVRGAHAFRASLQASGRASSIEEVLVCSASAADIARAKRGTERMAKQDVAPVAVSRTETPARTRSASGSGSRAASGVGSGARAGAGSRGRKRLDPARIEQARASAAPYNRTHGYVAGEMFIHPKFGVGEVQTVLRAENMVMVLFEDGEERRLLSGG
jgi:O-acetyl-ADP-ribose deacetylase (regulator of RNase III)